MTGEQVAGQPVGPNNEPIEAAIEAAVDAWARATFAAPRRLHALVTAVVPHDDIIERVATRIERRELREVRTASSERRSTRPRTDPNQVDPFKHTPETLKADSEYIAQCQGCAAAGRMRCPPCSGTGNGRCPTCHGSGKQTSAKTGQPIQCKSCKATGSAPCRHCAGSGSIPCPQCLGSGHQLAWLTIAQSERWETDVPVDNPLVITQPALRERRPIARGELAAVTVLEERSADGPLDLGASEGPYRSSLTAQRFDARLERVRHQQYVKITAIRRDVSFEMCGLRATLSLSGKHLAGATTREALRPIRRRLYLWIAAGLAVFIGGGTLGTALLGSASYFRPANNTVTTLALCAAGFSIPALGVILRAWRGGSRFHRMRWPTAMWAGLAALALIAIPVCSLLARPDLADVTGALATSNVARARQVLDAFRELHGASAATQEAEDRVLLAEAEQAPGGQRLGLLDAVAARHGTTAEQAAADALAQRLDDVRQQIASHHPGDALAMLDHAMASDHSAPVAEERARAHDALAAACTIVACRLNEARAAGAARSTPARIAAIEQAHAQALDTLDPKHLDAQAPLPRLQQLQRLRDDATALDQLAGEDPTLTLPTQTALELVKRERAKISVLHNSVAVAEELLERPAKTTNDVATIALDHGAVYLALDRSGQCTGVYATGDASDDRQLKSDSWPAQRLLAQIVGQPQAVIPPAAPGASISRGAAGGIPVVARWDSDTLIELRIGDATP